MRSPSGRQSPIAPKIPASAKAFNCSSKRKWHMKQDYQSMHSGLLWVSNYSEMTLHAPPLRKRQNKLRTSVNRTSNPRDFGEITITMVSNRAMPPTFQFHRVRSTFCFIHLPDSIDSNGIRFSGPRTRNSKVLSDFRHYFRHWAVVFYYRYGQHSRIAVIKDSETLNGKQKNNKL